MNRDEVLAALDLSDYRELAVGGALQFGVDHEAERLVTGVSGDHFVISNDALDSISDKFHIPRKFASEIPLDLLALNLNYLSQSNAKPSKVLVRESNDGSQVVGFMKNSAIQLLDMEGVLQQVEDNLGQLGELTYTRAQATTDLVTFTVVGPRVGEPVVGDQFQWGIAFTYSPTDQETLSLSGFSHRLVCLNGMFDTLQIAKITRRHPPEDIYEWIGTAAYQIYENAEPHFDRLRQASESRLSEQHHSDTIDAIYRDFQVPESARGLINNRIGLHGAETLYDVINHITYVATHDEEVRANPRLQTRLMRAAGNLSGHPSVCNQCERPL